MLSHINYQTKGIHGALNMCQTALALFCSINILICLWEIALFFYINRIKMRYEGFKKKLRKGEIPKIFLFEHVSISEVLTFQYWSEIWAVYSLLDSSYSDSGSFGFNVDIGNGFTTLIPSILFAIGMTKHDLLDPQILGMIGLLSFYQELYGTFVYFTQV